MKETQTGFVGDDGHLDDVAVSWIADGERAEAESFAAAVAHMESCPQCAERVADFALRSVEIDHLLRGPREAKVAAAIRVAPRAAPAIAIGIAVAVASSIPLWIGALEAVPEKLRVARTVFWVTLRTVASVSRDSNQMAVISIVVSTFAAVLFSTMGLYIARRASRVVKVRGEA
jgi:hypothetical protein